jgi:hypothetical protein
LAVTWVKASGAAREWLTEDSSGDSSAHVLALDSALGYISWGWAWALSWVQPKANKLVVSWVFPLAQEWEKS